MVDNGWESINCIPMYIACWWVPHTSSKPPFECSGWVWRRYLCMGILSCTTNRWFFAIPVYEGIYLIPPSFYRIDMKTSLLNYDVYIYILYIYISVRVLTYINPFPGGAACFVLKPFCLLSSNWRGSKKFVGELQTQGNVDTRYQTSLVYG